MRMRNEVNHVGITQNDSYSKYWTEHLILPSYAVGHVRKKVGWQVWLLGKEKDDDETWKTLLTYSQGTGINDSCTDQLSQKPPNYMAVMSHPAMASPYLD